MIRQLWGRLTKDEAAATFFRLAKSQHVADLQLIFWISLLLMLIGSVFAVVWHTWVDAADVIGSAALISAIVAPGSAFSPGRTRPEAFVWGLSIYSRAKSPPSAA